MRQLVPFAEAHARLSELADRVELGHERIVVTRDGRPSFVLMSPDDLDSLEETVEVIGDEALMQSLRVSRDQAEPDKRQALEPGWGPEWEAAYEAAWREELDHAESGDESGSPEVSTSD